MKGQRLNKVFKTLDECPPKYMGDIKPNRWVDLTGQTYNYLTVLYYIGSDKKRSQWLCHCNNCGKYVIVNSHNLRSGHTKSCGCLISENLRNDLSGQQFGYLKVLHYDCSKNESPYYIVQCTNCGKIYSANGYAIQKQISCGCINSIKANILLKTFKESDLNYISNVQTEKTFDDCVFRNKLKFDFYFPPFHQHTKGVVYEYDGEQHYKPIKFKKELSDTEMYKNFITNQIRDWIKDKYCILNNIPLIRIKYSSKKNPSYKEIINNEYIVGKAQASNDEIYVFDIIDADIVNYHEATFNILAGISCTFKCCLDNPTVCQNSDLCKNTPIRFSIQKLIERFNNQHIAQSVTLQGLECLDNLKQVLWFIYYFRQTNQEPIIIWTGYTKEECEDLIYLITEVMHWNNIIIKFGRFIMNRPSRYDEVLGVTLASDNQYAEKIS